MKILFFIKALGRSQGKGGHFHSLNHISAALGKKIEVGIYSIGPIESEVISKNKHYKGSFFFNGRNIVSLRKKILDSIKKFNPDILHCFDQLSYNIISFIVGSQYRIIVNKCGGPNPQEYPYVENLVLFSHENFKWFRSKNKFRKSAIYLIPNRVNKEELNIDNSFYDIRKKEIFCFVRIARIGEKYEKSIIDSIKLVEDLEKQHLEVHLYLIGTIENETIFSQLQYKAKNLPITFLTHDKYTSKASNMLYLADAIIATGRGVMEGTALGKPILTPAQNANYPILISQENFQSFFKTNFSERNIATNSDLKNNFNKIIDVVENKSFHQELKKQSLFYFKHYFDIETGVSKYLDVYNNVLSIRPSEKIRLRNIKYQLKTFYRYYKLSK